MGQKVDPRGLRLGISRDWDSKWYARKKDYANLLLEDYRIRDYVRGQFLAAGISRVMIERAANRIILTIHAAKPGMVIGKGGTGVEALRRSLEDMTGKHVTVNIVEVKIPELDATLVAESIAAQLERRVSFRRAMKQAIQRAVRLGAKGMRVRVSGRLGGAELARSERDWVGSVPLHTLRADVDYGFAEARTTYGQIGVKVWIYRGDVLPERRERTRGGSELKHANA